MALMASLFAAMFLTCVGLALVLLGSASTTLMANDGQARAAAYAAQAAATLSIAELRARPDTTGATTAGPLADLCATPGTLVDASLLPPAPWDGSLVDLTALTRQRQADSDAAAPAGLPGPVWRLFEYGPISSVVPSNSWRHPFYVAVWTADGRGGLLLLHATALGPGGVRASVEASIGPRGGVGRPTRLVMRAVP